MVAVAGCTAAIVEPFLEQEVRGVDFQAYLAREYQRRTRVERDIDQEWHHAGRLAHKGWAVLQGQRIDPWVPSEWNVAPQDLYDLERAREDLMARLQRGRRITPEACAKAQVYYDGWLEQAHDNDYGDQSVNAYGLAFRGPVQPDYVAAERASFEEVLPLCASEEALAAYPPIPSTVVAEPRQRSFAIFFGWNSDEITGPAATLLESITDYVNEIQATGVFLEGHSDRSGRPEYNDDLSRARAQAVRRALENRSVPIGGVTWFGESRPAVPTADNVRERLNRRVDVTVVRD